MYIEGDVFLVENKEYKLRIINQHNYCWLEPVVLRYVGEILSSGLNKIVHYDELEKYEYVEWRY